MTPEPSNEYQKLVEAVQVCRNRLDDIRDERHFPAHMLDVHDDMLEICDKLEAALSARHPTQEQG